ncbi:MAG: PD-(D/E)XK nuclease family protein [bacterium]
MSEAVLIGKGGDLIELARRRLLSAGEDLSRSLVIFPGQRPGHFLRKALARSLGTAFASPAYYSIDDWVDHAYYELGYRDRPLMSVDGVALLYQLHQRRGMPGSPEKTLVLDEFMPWGYKLLSDFEELKIEGIEPETLGRMQTLAQERLPSRVREVLTDLAGLYQSFYKKLEEKGCCTRSVRYQRVAQDCERLDLSSYCQILLAGFFALTNAEKKIFQMFLTRDNTSLLLQDGPGIDRLLGSLNLRVERIATDEKRPKVQYYKAPDAHGQVMKLNQIASRNSARGRQVLVLPESSTLFPVVRHTVPLLGEDWNISMGFPLFRTPIYGLLVALGRTLESRTEGHYFLPDYLRLVLHPYIKNLYLDKASYPSRILFHTVEEVLGRRQSRFIDLEDVESDRQILHETFKRLSGADMKGLDERKIAEHLRGIHGILLRPFDDLSNIGEFSEHLLELVSVISLESPANRHPYTSRFIESLIGALGELRLSDIASESFADIRGYFGMLDSYVKGIRVPFPGTPLKRFQIMGFLETRNLVFDTVYFMDTNEGVLPASRKEDTLLPMAVRKELGLPTYRQREDIARYYFENLIAGAKEVHIFYREDEGREKSRLVERLIWEEQQEANSVDLQNQDVIFFESVFSQRDPRPIRKNATVVAKLANMSFSAWKLDTYLSCPLRFYHEHVLELSGKGELSEQMDQMEIGSLVHQILKNFFETKKNKPLEISARDYEAIFGICDKLFEETFGQHLGGSIYLIRSQVRLRLRDILDHHRAEYRGAVILDCERRYSVRLQIPGLGTVNVKGRMDRIDRKGTETIILDYKTGTGSGTPLRKRFSLEDRSEWHKTLVSVQLPLYLLLYLCEDPQTKVVNLNSGLMMLGSKNIQEQYLFRDGDDRQLLYDQYREAIFRLIREILNPEQAFTDTRDPKRHCKVCGFKVTCCRQWVESRY